MALGELPTAVASQFDAPLVERLTTLRHAIHQDPELSHQEERTAARLVDALAEIPGVAVRRLAGTGVVARLGGSGGDGAPVIAIRGDIDALPIQEDTGLPFASRTAGVMHACGHDVHATWAVAAAWLLARRPAACDVVFLLQPAEETGEGAVAMMEAGALEGVAAIIGGHVDRRFPVGQVVVDTGRLAASTDTFAIELVGHGAHAARPHESADVVVATGALIGALQTIVARRLDPAIPGVVTVATVQAGTAPNVIPERAVLRGTIRAVDPRSRAMMRGALQSIATGVAQTHGVTATVTFDAGTPPIVNPEWPTSAVRRAAATVVGAESVVPLGTVNLAGEDFASYMERVPGCFVRVGAREPGGVVIPAHSPRFHAAAEAIFVGAAVLAEGARQIAIDLVGQQRHVPAAAG